MNTCEKLEVFGERCAVLNKSKNSCRSTAVYTDKSTINDPCALFEWG